MLELCVLTIALPSIFLVVAVKHIVDSAIFHLIKQWFKVPLLEQGKDGTKRNIDGCKLISIGTLQAGVISLLLANWYLHISIAYGSSIN